MGVSRYNSEGYPDPTTYEALTSIEKATKAARAYRPIVYVCSPFSGDIAGNIANARKYSRFAVEQGYIPIAPHLLFPQFLNDNDLTERADEPLQRGLGVRRNRISRNGCRNQESQKEKLQTALFWQ